MRNFNTILITGGAGFIGSNFIRYVLTKTDFADPALLRPEWIAFDGNQLAATLRHLPGGDAAPFPLDLPKVVEYYATRM